MKSGMIVLAALVAGVVSGGASAATGYEGFHAEAQGGWDHATAKLRYDDSVFTYQDKDSRNGVTYGLGAGYDVDLGGFLLGTEGALNSSSTKDCSTDDGVRDCLKFGREYEIGVRAGAQVGATGPLVYGKVAYVNARLKASESGLDYAITGHRNLAGVRVGVGLEQKVSRQFYVKAEYRYTSFKGFRLDDYTRASFDRHQVIGGVGVLF